ncbi:MAG: hypothetical protein NC115_05805 [Bacteroidales bacterium]|nr:hypothetical protein [Bacteroidales bacterium]
MNKKLYLIAVLTAMCCLHCLGQVNMNVASPSATDSLKYRILQGTIPLDESSMPDHYNLPSIHTPQAMDMVRYDNSYSDIAHGRASVSIPVIMADDPDFDLNISLSYATDGFKPMAPDNYVGMGWHLNFGGVITREVNGVPDEFYDLESDTNFINAVHANVSGMYAGSPQEAGLKERLLDGDAQNMGLREVLVGKGHSTKVVIPKNNDTELSPDIFRFSFGEHSGMFMIDFDKSIKVVSYSGGRYKVDLSGFGRRKNNEDISSVIRITTDDGYVYCFGGHYDAMDYTAEGWSDFYSSSYSSGDTTGAVVNVNYDKFLKDRSSQRNIPTSFYLSEVIAPNGRKMKIWYDSSVPSSLHQQPSMLIEYGSMMKKEYPDLQKNYSVSVSLSANGLNCSLEQCGKSYTLTKVALVRSISIDDAEIEFRFSSFPTPYFCMDSQKGSTYYEFVRGCGTKLDSIVFRSGGHVMEKAEFKYSVQKERLILTGVHNSRTGNYDMQYFPYGTFDKSLTIDVDMWGFWSSKGANTGYTQVPASPPKVNMNTWTYDRDPDDANRNPTGKEYDVFMLKSVTFPTGGKQEYEYEPHYYSQYYGQGPLDFKWQIYGTMSMKKLGGGARLLKESYTDGISSQPQVKYYRYSSDFSRSSGTLMQEGEYYLRLCTVPVNSSLVPDGSYMSDPAWGIYLIKPEPFSSYIEYGKVIEYDRPPESERPDSVYTVSTHPIDGQAIEKSIYLTVGDMPESEMLSTWTFYGESSPVRNLYASFSIYKGGKEIMSYTFPDRQEEITINPKSMFGDGYYRIDIHVDPMLVLNFTARYPRPMKFDGPYKVSRFSDPCLVFKSNAFYGIYRHCSDQVYLNFFKGFLDNYWGVPEYWSQMHNRILSETCYNAKGEIDRQVTYSYTKIDMGNVPYIYPYSKLDGASLIGSYNQVVDVPFFCYLQSGSTVMDHGSNGQEMTVMENMTYDRYGYVNTCGTVQSDGKKKVERYTYPLDYGDTVSLRMQELNMVSPVVSETVLVDSVQTFALKRDYSVIGDNAVVDTLLFSYGVHLPEPRAVYPEYDCYGNPLYIVRDGMVRTVYLWSYYGKYIVAKIDNASYDDVIAALGDYGPDEISSSAEPDMDAIDVLRSSLKNAMVTTFTYSPYVGMTSSTAPDGMTTWYVYDPCGRLAAVYMDDVDGNRSLVKGYEYNLINQ